MALISKEEMDAMIEKVEEEIGVGKVKQSTAYKELEAAIAEADRRNEESKARESRQMMDVRDVQEALGVSESAGYAIIRQLNSGLAEANYLTVRGKVSRAYFEKRTYGVSVNAG